MRLSIQGAEVMDKTALHEERDGNKNGEIDSRQRIFDERCCAVMDQFGELCEQHGCTVAFAVAIHPDDNRPMIFLRGHQYDAAHLATNVLNKLREDLIARLS